MPQKLLVLRSEIDLSVSAIRWTTEHACIHGHLLVIKGVTSTNANLLDYIGTLKDKSL